MIQGDSSPNYQPNVSIQGIISHLESNNIKNISLISYLIQSNKCCRPNIVSFQKVDAVLSSVNRITNNVIQWSTSSADCNIIFIINGTKIPLGQQFSRVYHFNLEYCARWRIICVNFMYDRKTEQGSVNANCRLKVNKCTEHLPIFRIFLSNFQTVFVLIELPRLYLWSKRKVLFCALTTIRFV